MRIVRPVGTADTDALIQLAASLGPGMTTFPNDKDVIAEKVQTAAESFSGRRNGADAQYLMVLEDLEADRILGVSAVYPEIGHPYGFFSYHIDRLVSHSESIATNLDCKVLTLSNAYTGFTEIGTLAVTPGLRQSGAGSLLARARYMLMATFPDLFAETVIAEMRGWQDEGGNSPVWSAIGERFFNIEFAEADKMSAVKGVEFIANLMPKFPIYLDLLPNDAQEAMGKAHVTSAIAMRMLVNEGFRFDNFIDVFDGGPQVMSPLKDIKTVRDSVLAKLSTANVGHPSQEFLVCNTVLGDFRMIRTEGVIGDGRLTIGAEVAKALRLGPDSAIRYVAA